MKQIDKGLIYIHLAVLLFGTAGLFGKFLDLSPFVIVYGRVAFAALSLGIYIWISYILNPSNILKSNQSTRIHHYNLKSSLLVILLGTILTVHWITFFHAIQISTVAIGLLSFSTFPIFVVFGEPLLLKSSFKTKYLYFALIVLIGVWLLIPTFDWDDNSFQGVFWGCISGFLFAILTITNKYLTEYYRPITLAFLQNAIAFIILLPFVLQLDLWEVKVFEWLIIILLGVLFTAVSHTFFIVGLKTVEARVTSIIACMEPVYGIFFAFIILSETLHYRTLFGGLVILCTTIYLSVQRA